MKLWTLTTFYAASLLIFSGCGGVKPTPQKEAIIDKTLPVVTLTQNGIFADINAIAFEWESIKEERVKGFYIYKAMKDSNLTKSDYYDTVNSRFSTHYVDRNIEPDTKYSYYFKTFSDKAESQKTAPIYVNSLPVMESVSWIHSIQNMPRSAKILWRPHTNQKVKAYIIERRTLKEDAWSEIATLEGRLNAEYIDVDLQDNTVYMYRVKVLTFDNITSTPSQMVKVVTKELPAEVTNIVATKDVPRKIELTWDKSTAKDFSLYYVYRSEKVDGSYTLVAKLHNNIFVDKIEEDAKEYFYRVSVVDVDELESKYKEKTIQGKTLSKPKTPAILEAKIIQNRVELVWSKADQRAVSYVLLKVSRKGWFEKVSQEIRGIKTEQYRDTNIEPNTTYYYQVFAVDVNSIRSQPTLQVELKSAEVLDIPAPQTRSVEKEEEVVLPKAETLNKDIVIPTKDFN